MEQVYCHYKEDGGGKTIADNWALYTPYPYTFTYTYPFILSGYLNPAQQSKPMP